MSHDGFNEALAELYAQFQETNNSYLKMAEEMQKAVQMQIDQDLLENALRLVRYEKSAFAPGGGGGGMPMDPMMMGGMPGMPPGPMPGMPPGPMPGMPPGPMPGMPPGPMPEMPPGPTSGMLGGPTLGGESAPGGNVVPPEDLASAATEEWGEGTAGGGKLLNSLSVDEFKATMTDAVEKGVSGLVQVLTRELSDLTEKISALVDRLSNPAARV